MESCDLKSWYDVYNAEDDNLTSPNSEAVQAVTSDQLDHTQVELRIGTLRSSNAIVGNFCTRCHHLLQHWPAPPRLGHAMVESRFSTVELEAAARNGCRFCAFVFTRLVAYQTLTTVRKVEARMEKLRVDAPISLAIQNWTGHFFTSQLLWVNFLGKSASQFNSHGAQHSTFESRVLPPSCRFDQGHIDSLGRHS